MQEHEVCVAPSDYDTTVFVMGAQPWNRDRVIAEAASTGLNVVAVKTVADSSDDYLARQRGSKTSPDQGVVLDSQVLPSDCGQIPESTIDALTCTYGPNLFVMGLNDYATECAAALSCRLSSPCYPEVSAEIVKRKHKLRVLWNRLAADNRSQLCGLEFCYAEKLDGRSEFTQFPSAGFEMVREDSHFIVKPDELSGSIEVARVTGKANAVQFAQHTCTKLDEKWKPVGRIIGAEVRPRVIVEQQIDRSSELHPGAEFSAEFVSFNGVHHAVGVTQKWTGSNYVETGHMFPARSLPSELEAPLNEAIQSLLNQLEVRYSVSHWEFIVTADRKIALVEGHLRAAGGRILDLIDISTGDSPTRSLCRAFATANLRFEFTPQCQAGLFWMVPETPLATVSSIEFGDLARSIPQERLFINEREIRSKHTWSGAHDWMTRLAHVIGTGADPDSLLSFCRDIARDIVLCGLREGKAATTRLMLAIDRSVFLSESCPLTPDRFRSEC